MDRWNCFLAVIILISLGPSTVQSRKIMICSHGGGPFRGWFAMKLVQTHNEGDQVFETINKQAGFVEHHLQRLWDLQHAAMTKEGLSKLFETLIPPLEDSTLLKPTFEKDLFHTYQRQSLDNSFICNTCLNISTYAEQVLSDPDTLNQALSIVNDSVCGIVMPGLQEECTSLAEEYIPKVFQLLQENLTPEHLCVDTKLCPDSTMTLHSNTICKKCEEFTTEALKQLSENSTETQVLSDLHSACSMLGMFSIKCDILVDTYGPALFMEVQSVTPQEFCQKVKLCNAVREKKSHCATCEYVILEMKYQLQNPVNQEKLMELLSDECTKVPNYVNQCKEIVGQYGPFVLANVDSFLDADTLCTKIHACEAIPASRVIPAIRTKGNEEIKERSQEMMEPLIKLPSVSHEHVVQ